MNTLPYLSLRAVTALHGAAIEAAVERVVRGGRYLLGSETSAFESEWAAYCGQRHCVGCGNGLDALTLTLRAWKEMGRLADGDEVLVPANTYIATLLAVTECGLRPVPVEPQMPAFGMSPSAAALAVTPRTRCLLLVHLYGYDAWQPAFAVLCRRYNLLLLEDCAQAHGLRPHTMPGSAAAFSFYPGKNLGALGDAGCVTTDDAGLAETVRAIANYGSRRKYVFRYKGRNSRLDELQAAVLRAKLPFLDGENARRREIADIYIRGILPRESCGDVACDSPDAMDGDALLRLPQRGGVFHIFPLLCRERDALRQYLAERGIETLVHYPIPPHRQEAYAEWAHLSLPLTESIAAHELSLPCNPTMSDADAQRVVEAINTFPTPCKKH